MCENCQELQRKIDRVSYELKELAQDPNIKPNYAKLLIKRLARELKA